MIPRRGSRRIVVDGEPYRWRVRRSPTYAQGNAWSGLAFVVEHADSPGAVLRVELPGARPDNWVEADAGVATPTDVARAVRLARAGGWEPRVPGEAFRLVLPSGG